MSRATMRRAGLLLGLAVASVAVDTAPVTAQTPAQIQSAVDAAYAKYRNLQEGKNADYIPALAKVDPKVFGIAVVTGDGKVYTAGDLTTEVSIQSISKVFTMARVIEDSGTKALVDSMGVDATTSMPGSAMRPRATALLDPATPSME